MKVINTFVRNEKKYRLNQDTYLALRERIGERMQEDQYGWDLICSMYYDTEHSDLIRRSIEKPVYKEKMRIRSYGVPDDLHKVYIEIKKKYKGIVYKRRVALAYKQAMDFLETQNIPQGISTREHQICQEILYCLQRYNLSPKMFIGYTRLALFCPEKPSLRITFDSDIRFRTENLTLAEGAEGTAILPQDQLIMEIKEIGAVPLWLAHILTELNIMPASFSKYGTAYKIINE